MSFKDLNIEDITQEALRTEFDNYKKSLANGDKLVSIVIRFIPMDQTINLRTKIENLPSTPLLSGFVEMIRERIIAAIQPLSK